MKIKAKDLAALHEMKVDADRNESRQLKDSLPPGHPLLQEVQAEEMRSGDIADLPDSHPLKVALREARDRLMAQQAKEAEKNPDTEGGQKSQEQIRKAKRIDERDNQRRKMEAEEEAQRERLEKYQDINTNIDELLTSVDKLMTSTRLDGSIFGEDRYSMMKVARLNRMMFAIRAGLRDSKLRTREA